MSVFDHSYSGEREKRPNIYLEFFFLRLVSFASFTVCLRGEPDSVFSTPSCSVGAGSKRSLPFLLQAEQTQFLQCLCVCPLLQPMAILVASPGLSPVHLCLSCTRQSQTRHCTLDVASQEPEKKDHLAWSAGCILADTALSVVGLLSQKDTLLTSVQLFILQDSPDPFL